MSKRILKSSRVVLKCDKHNRQECVPINEIITWKKRSNKNMDGKIPSFVRYLSPFIILLITLSARSHGYATADAVESFESLRLNPAEQLDTKNISSSIISELDPHLASASHSVEKQQVSASQQYANSPLSNALTPKLVVQVFRQPPVDDAPSAQSTSADLNGLLRRHNSVDQMVAESTDQTLSPPSTKSHLNHGQLSTNYPSTNNVKQQPVAAHQRDPAPRVWRERDIALAQSAAGKRPPVYMSAPKQISQLSELALQKPTKKKADHSVEHQAAAMKKVGDLHTAAGHYKSKTKKKKIKYVKSYKHQSKKYKKPKKRKMKKKPMMEKYHHYAPSYGGNHYKQHNYDKYYEYRSVPKKGAWEFGYKRGNAKHTVERKEHGHKSHFKTEVKWKDKKGKGHHVFDYNHGDHKHRDYHQAAATSADAKDAKSRLNSGPKNAPKRE